MFGEKQINMLIEQPIHPHQKWRRVVNRARVLLSVVFGAVCVLTVLRIRCVSRETGMTFEDQVSTILARVPLIGMLRCWVCCMMLTLICIVDGHDDFAIWIRAFYHNHIYAENFTGGAELYGQVDIPRLKQGQLRGQFWSVYVEW